MAYVEDGKPKKEETQTYEEWLASQYAAGNTYSTGDEAAPTYAWGQAAVNDAAPPPPESGLPTQQETLDHYAEQSINDYGPPPQPEYVPTDVSEGSMPPAPPPTGGMWDIFSGASDLAKKAYIHGSTAVDDAINRATIDYYYMDRSNPVPNPNLSPPAGLHGSEPARPPGYEPGTVSPMWNRDILWEANSPMVPSWADGYAPADRYMRSHPIAPSRLYPSYWLNDWLETGEFPQSMQNRIERRQERRDEARAERGKPPRRRDR